MMAETGVKCDQIEVRDVDGETIKDWFEYPRSSGSQRLKEAPTFVIDHIILGKSDP